MIVISIVLGAKFYYAGLKKLIFEPFRGTFFTMTSFSEMTYIYDQTRDKNENLRPEVEVGDILKMADCKMFTQNFSS